MSAIGVGLIGTGYMGKRHALAWTGVGAVFGDTPQVRLAVLCEVTEELAQKRVDEFGFSRATADWRALIADPDVDVVSVTTPNAFHVEMAIAALAAGKHVWCEKPMAPDLADAERTAEAARRSGRVAISVIITSKVPPSAISRACSKKAGSARSIISASKWTRIISPIWTRPFPGAMPLRPAMARSTISPCIR